MCFRWEAFFSVDPRDVVSYWRRVLRTSLMAKNSFFFFCSLKDYHLGKSFMTPFFSFPFVFSGKCRQEEEEKEEEKEEEEEEKKEERKEKSDKKLRHVPSKRPQVDLFLLLLDYLCFFIYPKSFDSFKKSHYDTRENWSILADKQISSAVASSSSFFSFSFSTDFTFPERKMNKFGG